MHHCTKAFGSWAQPGPAGGPYSTPQAPNWIKGEERRGVEGQGRKVWKKGGERTLSPSFGFSGYTPMQSTSKCNQFFVRPFVKRFALCYQTVVYLSAMFVHCGQTVGRIKIKLGMKVGLGPGHTVLDGDPVPLPQRGTAPPSQFSAHICCGQMAAWIKMSLGMELGLGPGDFVRHGDPAPLPKTGLRNFRSITIVAKRLDASRCHLVWK